MRVIALETEKFVSKQGQALVASMFYEYRLNELGKEFAARNLAPVIVKGQAIVDLAFPKDEVRLSSDIDLLVGDDAEPIATALTEIGYEEDTPHSRHFRFGERGFHQHEKRLPGYVEVHRCLDKIFLRPIPYAEILARAKPSGRSGFRYPTMEDLLLLVVLHASADIFFDLERVQRDLRFLLGHAQPDPRVRPGDDGRLSLQGHADLLMLHSRRRLHAADAKESPERAVRFPCPAKVKGGGTQKKRRHEAGVKSLRQVSYRQETYRAVGSL